MQGYVTAPALAALGGLYLAILASLARAFWQSQSQPAGWQVLRPGISHWFALTGALIALAIMSWVWMFVGSARRDAAFQMQVAYWLVVAFSVCAVHMALTMARIKKANLRWRGASIAFEDAHGVTQNLRMCDLEAVRRTVSGTLQFRFAAGTMLSVDPYAQGSDALLLALFENSGPGTQPA